MEYLDIVSNKYPTFRKLISSEVFEREYITKKDCFVFSVVVDTNHFVIIKTADVVVNKYNINSNIVRVEPFCDLICRINIKQSIVLFGWWV